MKQIINTIINKSKNISMLIIGDFMIDEYLIGKVERINPEAPVPILNVKEQEFKLGGCGNVVNNVLEFTNKLFVSTVLGDDDDANIIKKLIHSNNINVDGIFVEKDRKTTRKTRLMSEHHNIMRYDRESNHSINIDSENKIVEYAESVIDKVNCVVLEDYGKGVFTKNVLNKIIELCNKANKYILIDPNNKTNWEYYSNATILTPNREECLKILNLHFNKYSFENEEDIEKGGFEIIKKFNIKYLLITRSEEGMSLFCRDENLKIDIPTKAKDVYDVTGAGDSVIASYSVALSVGLSFLEAAYFSNIVGGISVSKAGASSVKLDEIIENIKFNSNIYLKNKKIKNLTEIKQIINILKNDNKKIVFTNGCFDIIHSGHIRYLEESSNLGDILIVGVNDDDSVRRLKGNSRPINNIHDRLDVLSAISFIDYLIIFSEDTPYEIIKNIKPDVLVKGDDYKIDEIVGYDIVKENGGEVKVIPLVKGKSTTSTINKMLIS